jgi:hypothetical protein
LPSNPAAIRSVRSVGGASVPPRENSTYNVIINNYQSKCMGLIKYCDSECMILYGKAISMYLIDTALNAFTLGIYFCIHVLLPSAPGEKICARSWHVHNAYKA